MCRPDCPVVCQENANQSKQEQEKGDHLRAVFVHRDPPSQPFSHEAARSYHADQAFDGSGPNLSAVLEKNKATIPAAEDCMTRQRWPFMLMLILTAMSGAAAFRGQSSATKDEPYVADYYYKAKWGYADEFIRLFKKNHFPILAK